TGSVISARAIPLRLSNVFRRVIPSTVTPPRQCQARPLSSACRIFWTDPGPISGSTTTRKAWKDRRRPPGDSASERVKHKRRIYENPICIAGHWLPDGRLFTEYSGVCPPFLFHVSP